MSAFLKDLLSDDHGHWDIGFVSMFVLIVLILGVIPLMCAVALARFFLVPGYPFQFLELGQSVGLITAAFTGPLAGLAAYIMAMKRPTAPLPPGTVTTLETKQTQIKTENGDANQTAAIS